MSIFKLKLLNNRLFKLPGLLLVLVAFTQFGCTGGNGTSVEPEDVFFQLSVKIFGDSTTDTILGAVKHLGLFRAMTQTEATPEPTPSKKAGPCAGQPHFEAAVACCENANLQGVAVDRNQCRALAQSFCDKPQNKDKPMCKNQTGNSLSEAHCNPWGWVWNQAGQYCERIAATVAGNIGLGEASGDFTTAQVCRVAEWWSALGTLGPEQEAQCNRILSSLLVLSCHFANPTKPVCDNADNQLCVQYDYRPRIDAGSPATYPFNPCPVKEIEDFVKNDICKPGKSMLATIADQCKRKPGDLNGFGDPKLGFVVWSPISDGIKLVPDFDPDLYTTCKTPTPCPMGDVIKIDLNPVGGGK